MCIECEHEKLSRRKFLARTAGAAFFALGTDLLAQQRARVKTIEEPNVRGEFIKFPNGSDAIDGFLARPRRRRRRRMVLILHGNAALPPDVTETAKKAARLGFIGLAVSSTSREADIAALTREFLSSDRYIKRYIADARAGISFLKNRAILKDDEYAIIGFCGGGYTAARMAVADSNVRGIVPLYAAPAFHAPRNSPDDPRPDLLDFVGRIKIPMQFHYGTKDHLIPMSDVRKLEEIIKTDRLPAEIHAYADADHGFANLTGVNYMAGAALSAEKRWKKFLKKHL